MGDRVDLPPLILQGVRREVDLTAEVPDVKAVFGALQDVLRGHGILYAAPETALYRFVREGVMEVTVGVPVDRDIEGLERFEFAATPAMKTVHYGPFDRLPGVFAALRAQIAAKGLGLGPYGREVYRLIAKDADMNEVDVYLDVVDEEGGADV